MHAKLSPSSAARWLTCTASVLLESGVEDKPSEYAAEGTYAHSLCELEGKYAVGQISKRSLTAGKKKIYDEKYHSAEAEEAAAGYAEYIKEETIRCENAAGEAPVVMFEKRLNLEQWAKGSFGTADCIIISGDTVHVIDFKYGKGVEVLAEGNPQMMLYAAGAWALFSPLYDIETVRMTIIQPRLNSVSEAEISAADLESWLEGVVKPKAQEALSGEGVFAPGDAACRFCKAKDICSARAEQLVALFEDNRDTKVLSNDRLGEILEMSKDMKNWLEDLKAKATSLLMGGETVPGWKLVEAKTNRQITDEAAAAAALEKAGLSQEQIYTRKLAGITALEKLLGKKKVSEVLADVIVKPKGGPALAPVTDKRPEIHPEEAIINAFEEE